MKINDRAILMRETVQKVVPMLAMRSVPVTMRGMQAFVEYDKGNGAVKRVNLPYVPDDASDELISAVEGFLDHEVAHILFSDHRALKEAVALGSKTAFFQNAIEDPYGEGKMSKAFTGSAYNLSNTARFFLKEMVDPQFKVAKMAGDQAQIASVLTVPAVRAWAGQPDFIEYMEDKWQHVEEMRRILGDDLTDQIGKVQNSMEGLELAKEMVKRLGDAANPPPPEDEEGDDKSSSGKSEGKDKSKDKADKDKEKDKSKAGEDEKGEGSGASSSGDEGKDDGDGEGSSSGSPDDEQDGAQGEEGTEGNRRPEMNSEFAENLMAAIANQDGFDEGLAEALSARAQKEAKSSDYLIFTRDDDRVEPMRTNAQSDAAIPAMHAAVDQMLSPMQKDIERMIQARSAAVWTGGHKRGRLHGAALTRLQFGRDDVFRRKQENHTKDVAVELVVDCSGSMAWNAGSKLRTACYSAFALASVLERLGIPCEVVGFTTRQHSTAVMNDLKADPLFSDYARWEALYMPVFKAFDERLTPDVKSRFTYPMVSNDLCRSNVDGESVILAHRRLAQRREARKVMMVLSDGQPACHGAGDLDGHLKAAVTKIEGSGTDVVGIGIMDRSVQSYYKRHVIINSVDELPGVVMGELKKMLMV